MEDASDMWGDVVLSDGKKRLYVASVRVDGCWCDGVEERSMMEGSLGGGGGGGGSGAGMEVPLVRESERDGERGPIWKDSADWPMRGTDFLLIWGPTWEVMMAVVVQVCQENICSLILWRSCGAKSPFRSVEQVKRADPSAEGIGREGGGGN